MRRQPSRAARLEQRSQGPDRALSLDPGAAQDRANQDIPELLKRLANLRMEGPRKKRSIIGISSWKRNPLHGEAAALTFSRRAFLRFSLGSAAFAARDNFWRKEFLLTPSSRLLGRRLRDVPSMRISSTWRQQQDCTLR